MVVIDTDILMLAFAFQNDPRQADNALFLTQVRPAQPAITTYNLMGFWENSLLTLRHGV